MLGRRKNEKDEIFRAIDSFSEEEVANELYMKKLNQIDETYSKSDKMEKMVADKSIIVLLKRRAELLGKINYNNDVFDIMMSVPVSIMAASLVGIIIRPDKMLVELTIIGIAIIAIPLFVVLLYHKNRLNNDKSSVKRYIREYEIKIIDKKIQEIRDKANNVPETHKTKEEEHS